MDDVPYQRKPRMYFETDPSASHVTFDDGTKERLNLPWLAYARALWEYANPDTINVEFNDWLIVIHGNNLEPLFRAIGDRKLTWLCAQSAAWREETNREIDTFATEILILKPMPGTPAKRRGQIELNLGA